jgi:hypothetical protein
MINENSKNNNFKMKKKISMKNSINFADENNNKEE